MPHDATHQAHFGASPDPRSSMPGSRGLCVRSAELSAVRENAREVDFICSTDFLDSYGEIVRQNWNLTRFSGNPVALWSHQAHELPIGYWKNVRVEDGALRGTLVVATAAANPKAENVWQSIREKTLRAVSVGFMPGKVTYEELPGKEGTYCVLDENDLFEISPTPLPANPEALVEMKAKALELHRQKKITAPAGAPKKKEARVATKTNKDMVECPGCGKEFDPEDDGDGDEDEKSKAAKRRCSISFRARVAPIARERDAAVTKMGELEKVNGELAGRLLSAEVEPLVGSRIAPAELEGHVAIGKHFASQGEAGAAKWKSHLDALKARPDMKMLGGSVLPIDKTPSGLTTASVADLSNGDDMVALVTASASA